MNAHIRRASMDNMVGTMNAEQQIHISPSYSIVGDIQSECGYIIISSGEKYDYLGMWPNVLILHFADTEDQTRYDAITSFDIHKIYKFIEKCAFADVFISCDAGESRSPAVAAGLLVLLGKDDSYIWESDDYRPNTLVFRLLLEMAGCSNTVAKTELTKLECMSPDEYRKNRKRRNNRSK